MHENLQTMAHDVEHISTFKILPQVLKFTIYGTCLCRKRETKIEYKVKTEK